MTAAQPLALPITRQSARGDNPKALTAIYREDVNMAIWHRCPSAPWADECRSLLAGAFSGIRLVLPESKLTSLADVLPELKPFPQLLDDVRQLADMFCCLFDVDTVGLRLTSLDSAMCPKFHVDRVPCRLITTYCGTGTEWLAHSDVDRSKLGTGSNGISDAHSGLYASAQRIQCLQPGDVALLKGELWEGNEGAGLVHRSPEVDPGEKRLLLTLDFA